jgi:predicted GNAT family acetyltransferase
MSLQAGLFLGYATNMKIIEERTGKKGEFYIEKNGERVAMIQYFDSAEGQITVYHTEVDASLRGQGVGEDLVERIVKYARDKGLRIVATCPFARKLIEDNADIRSVLA